MTLVPSEVTAGEKSLEALSHSSDSSIKKLADAAIEFAEKFVKKSSSPVSPQHSKQKRT
jgi:hypothetical protein